MNMTCYNCGHDSVIWQCDYSFSDCGMEGEGIVSVWACPNCGAEIDVIIPDRKEEDNED